MRRKLASLSASLTSPIGPRPALPRPDCNPVEEPRGRGVRPAEAAVQLPEALCYIPGPDDRGDASEWSPFALTLAVGALRLSDLKGEPEGGGVSTRSCSIPLATIVDVTAPDKRLLRSLLQKDAPADANTENVDPAKTLTERSTLEGYKSAHRSPQPEFNERGGFRSLEPEDSLSSGVMVGAFDLPPIPLARLPESRSGLPPVDLQSGAVMRVQRMLQDYPSAFGGIPMMEYDGSNCQPHVVLDAPIPPLPPSECRLPTRTHRDLRTLRERRTQRLPGGGDAAGAGDAAGGGVPFQHVLVVWMAVGETLAKPSVNCKQQQGSPMFLCFPSEADASLARETLLRLRDRAPESPERGGALGGPALRSPERP